MDCLIQTVFINLDVIHDNIDLGLLINIFPDFHHEISCNLNGVFHVFVHLALVAYKDDM